MTHNLARTSDFALHYQIVAGASMSQEQRDILPLMERDSSTLMNALQERLIGELKSYADGRKASVLRNAETEALAGLLLEKFGYGLATAARIAAELLDRPAPDLITEVERSVAHVDPRAKTNREKRRAARPAGISIK
jgi:hypothetical protein